MHKLPVLIASPSIFIFADAMANLENESYNQTFARAFFLLFIGLAFIVFLAIEIELRKKDKKELADKMALIVAKRNAMHKSQIEASRKGNN